MPKKRGQIEMVGEELKIAVTLALQNFNLQDEPAEIEFPSSLTANERAYIHKLATHVGLKSKSRGKAANRFLTVYKKQGSTIVQADAVFQLVRSSRHHITSLLSKYPVTNRERQDLLPPTERDRLPADMRDVNRTTGRLNTGVPQVPPPRSTASALSRAGAHLPIRAFQEDILRTVAQHQVTLLVGDTGCGKTTQLPQMLLDQHHLAGKPLRILCTEPRRLAAFTMAERVAAERDEQVGQTVGYQIRLESRVSPKTLLTFCTNGVLLRTLMGNDSALASLTHIIIDEVHERDRFADFLLTVLRDCLPKYRNLKLILMSAAMDAQLFVKYFHMCPVIRVPGRLYEVKQLFLEDALRETGYNSAAMKRAGSTAQSQTALQSWTDQLYHRQRAGDEVASSTAHADRPALPAPILGQQSEPQPDRSYLEPELIANMDQCIADAWLTAAPDDFTRMLHLIISQNVSVDYQHSETSASALMVAAGRGHVATVDHLLGLGASCSLRAGNGWSARDWALRLQQTEVVELLDATERPEQLHDVGGPDVGSADDKQQLTPEDREALRCYQLTQDDERVDTDLVMAVLEHVCTTLDSGSVLVFLPGYDDIVHVRGSIAVSSWFDDGSQFCVFVLHSSMQSVDQRRVFQPSPPGVRKIILATDIAETSITIEDIVYVVDGGKVKEKTYDPVTGVSMLRTGWISRSSAVQRRGRAGRCQPGVCFHLMSRSRFLSLQPYKTPEILRTPLQELCLHTKLLSPPNTPIADFLARTPEPPPFMVTRAAVQLLKNMDALDPWEDLTELGHHLMGLPVEPRLGKAVIFSVVLKCLDPVLTIVCCLAYRDPFQLPRVPAQKRSAKAVRKKLSAGSFSDHMVLLRAFQAWQRARSEGWERSYCEQNFISGAAMEMVMGMRTQLLGQLRASGFVRARGAGDIRDLNSHSENWAVVKAALCAGCYPSLARVDRDQQQLRTQRESRVRLHPSSVLAGDTPRTARAEPSQTHRDAVQALPADWLLHEQLWRSGRTALLHCCTLVTPVTVALMAGPARLPLDAVSEADAVLRGMRGDAHLDEDSDSGAEQWPDGQQKTMLRLDEWLWFAVDADAAHLALQLRQKWHALLVRRLRAPSRAWTPTDEAVLRALVAVLTTEEQSLGLQQPSGIGQRPRPIASDVFAAGSGGGGASSGAVLEAAVQQSPCTSPTPDALLAELGASSSRFFIVKATSARAVDVSVQKGVWQFACGTERRLVQCVREGCTVLLVLSVQGSGHFQGVARFPGVLSTDRCPTELQTPGSGHTYKLEWLKRGDVAFQSTRHLINPYNEHRRVQTGRDGQEVQPQVGAALCRLWVHAEPTESPPPLPPAQPPVVAHYSGRPIRGKAFVPSNTHGRGYYAHRH